MVLSDHSVGVKHESIMAYSDFSVDQALKLLGVTLQMVKLFPELTPLSVSEWLSEALAQGRDLAFSEKARSEFIVCPILLATRRLSHKAFTIHSGQRLDVQAKLGLVGECDFILGASPIVLMIRSPKVTIVQAREHDVEVGLGPCIAQMVGARIFNEPDGHDVGPIFGCVTTGEIWQFLRLEESAVSIDRIRYYISNVGLLLAVWQAVIPACQRAG
jgi:hypothetical protein